MTRRHRPFSSVRRFRWLTWCLILLGGFTGAFLVISGVAVRTDVGKLGAVDSMEFYVYAFGITIHRTRVHGFGLISQILSLCRAWSGALADIFTLIGALVGAAVAHAGRGLLRSRGEELA